MNNFFYFQICCRQAEEQSKDEIKIGAYRTIFATIEGGIH